MMSKRIIFILHPLNVNEFKRKTYLYEPFGGIVSGLLNLASPSFIKSAYSLLPPHLFLKENGLKMHDAGDSGLDLYGIMCPVFPEQVVHNKSEAFKKIKKAIALAIKNQADVVVLTGFTSMISEHRSELDKFLLNGNVSITSGNALTAILSIYGLNKALKIFNKDSQKMVMALIGASGDIGSLCVRLTKNQFKKIILCARNIETSNRLDKYLSGTTHYQKMRDINEAVKEADVILLATSSYLPLIDEKYVKSGAIICDTSLPHNVDADFARKRSDVFVFDGGLAAIEFKSKSRKLTSFLGAGGMYGCVAEGVLLGVRGIKKRCFLNNDDLSDADLSVIQSGIEEMRINVPPFTFHGECLK